MQPHVSMEINLGVRCPELSHQVPRKVMGSFF